MTTPPRSLPLLALVLLVAVVVTNVPIVAGGQTWSDVRYHTEVAPPRLAAGDAIRAGALPAWWDGTGLGVPLAGEPSHGALYPPTWLAASPRALDLVAIAHLAWAALGIAIWARRRATEPAALVAGLLVAASGLAVSAAVRGALPAIAHLPWIGAVAAWLGDAADRRTRARAAIALGALLGLVALTGVLSVLGDAIGLALAVGLRRQTRLALAGALGCGVAIGAAQWLPGLAQLGAGAGTEVHGLPLARLLELIVPGSFGSPEVERGIAALAGGAPWAPSLFVGAPLLALSAVRTPPRRVLGAVAALGVLALVAGRGGWPGWLGAPELHLAVLATVLAPLAAEGLDALLAAERRAVIAVSFGAACAGVALGALGALRARHPEAAPAIDRALVDGGLGVASIAAAVAVAWRLRGRGRAVALACIVLPSVGALPATAPVTERVIVDDPPAWAAAATAGAAAPPPRFYRPPRLDDHPEALVDAIATLAGTSASRWGLAAARSDDPARPRDHDRAWAAAAADGGVLLDRFGIGLAVLPQSVVDAARARAPASVRVLGERGAWTFVSAPAAPVAAVMRGWSWAIAADDALALLFPVTGRLPGGAVALRGTGASQPERGPPLPCSIAAWTPGEIELACTTDAPGYAVVASTAAAGWRAEVDGSDAPWVTADVLRRAVMVDAGAHRLRWTYTAPGLRAGIAIAALGVLGLLALMLAARRR